MDTNLDTDFIVVGGSFAGLAAALQLARANRSVRVIDVGRPRNRFAATSHGFLGHDGRDPRAILDDGASQLLAYPKAAIMRGEAISAQRSTDGFEVDLESGERLRCKRLILATGVVDALPAIPGLAERWGATVLHCPYCHGYEVTGQRLGVIACGPLSPHTALLIADWSSRLTYFANGFELAPEQAAALGARGVSIEYRPLAALDGDAPGLDCAVLEDGTRVPLDAAFIAPQASMASPLAHQLGCAFAEGPLGPYVRTDECQLTSVPGVYAAGDMTRFRHSATFAAADGVGAGVFAHQSIVFA